MAPAPSKKRKALKKTTIPTTATNPTSKPDTTDSDAVVSKAEINLPLSKPASAASEDDENEASDDDEYSMSGSDTSASSSTSSLSSILHAQHEKTTASAASKKRKRHDPTVFSTSMSKILSSHLTTTARKDPVLVRAKKAEAVVDDGRLEAKARRVLKEEKRMEMEKGRVRDVLLKGDEGEVGRALELERGLRKVAQRGVVKLFNAVRAAQIKGEEASMAAKQKGVVGMANREEKVTEMSKKGFLDLIQSSGKAKSSS